MDIKLQGITKEYNDGENKKILPVRCFDFELKEGETAVFTGPSGSGKSTLLNIIGLLEQPDSGFYYLDGERVDRLSEKSKSELRNRHIGYVLQYYGVISYRNVGDNVSLPLMFNNNIKKKDYMPLVKSALATVGLSDYLTRNVHNLSGGEKQRVAIARAIVNNPDIILADEPTGALDSKNKAAIIELLHDLKSQGKSLIIVTHDMELANEFPVEYTFKSQGVIEKVRG